MNWSTWLAFTVMETVLIVTPGPAVLFTISEGIRGGVRSSIGAAAGIVAANGVYFVLSAAGLAAIVASYDVFAATKYVGAAYLIWLGAKSVLASSRDAAASEAATPAAASARGAVARGFLLQGASPKTLLFFASILPQFIDTARPVWLQVLILGVTSIVLELLLLTGYGVLASTAAPLARKPGFARGARWASGVLLIGAGLGLARS
jgi:homoserine/homoserine lactone efflux protein